MATLVPSGYLPQQQQQQRRRQPYRADGMGSAGGAISANAYSSGTDQNNGNVMTGRSTTRRLAPPGGQSSFSIGWSAGVRGGSEEGIVRGGKRINHRARAGQAVIGGGPTGGGIGRGTAHMFPSVQLPERKHELIGYQKPEITGSRWETISG